jgi:uncharacterized protein YbjT (DUF2867 family)
MPSILIAGATGLVGRAAVQLAASDRRFAAVIALVRRPTTFDDGAGRVEVRLVDWDGLESTPEACRADAILCALGTTMRDAGSREAFRRVDHDYVMTLARVGLSQGATHFLLVSAVGADVGSRIFYNQVKGEVEAGVAGLGYAGVTVARPSFLVGERREARAGERIAGVAGRLLPERWRPVRAEQVAGALLEAAALGPRGLRVLDNAALRRHRVMMTGQVR